MTAEYRGWRIYWEPGLHEHGIVYQETGWAAAKDGVRPMFVSHDEAVANGGSGFLHLKKKIDRREDVEAAAHRARHDARNRRE